MNDTSVTRTAQISRKRVIQAALLILVGSAGIQASSALSSTLFDAYGPFAVSSLRLPLAALVLIALFRPSLRGRTRQEWLAILVYGVVMATMNLSLYAAIDRIPLGIAVTLEFLGPCVIALLASRRIREGLIAVLAFTGVVIISVGPQGYFDLIGYLFALAAAVSFALYTLYADRVGKAGTGLSGLALSVTVAAAITLPFSVPAVTRVTPSDWLLLALSALIGVVVPYAVDTIAGRITSARVIGTLFAIDPAMAALAAMIILGESTSANALVGILLVCVSGALLVWVSGRNAERRSVSPEAAA